MDIQDHNISLIDVLLDLGSRLFSKEGDSVQINGGPHKKIAADIASIGSKPSIQSGGLNPLPIAFKAMAAELMRQPAEQMVF